MADSSFIPPGLGWHRDLPDPRDYSPGHNAVVTLLASLKSPKTGRSSRGGAVDLRDYCPPVRDQQKLNSAASQACVALIQYFERRSSGRLLEPSRLFVYKMSRRLMHWNGDAGAKLRTTLKAIARFGLPPEQHWPYLREAFDRQPPPDLYCYRDEWQALVHVRLDDEASPSRTLQNIKRYLRAGFPVVFGFTAFTSITREADIPFPSYFDAVRGGHAVLAVGYADGRRIGSAKGALLVHNSWGAGWGDSGYGWLPYDYVNKRLAADFWTVLHPRWLESGEFVRPR